MKNLDSRLFEKSKVTNESLNSVLGGKKEIDGCYSGSGYDPNGYCHQEFCVVYDDGSFEIQTVPCD